MSFPFQLTQKKNTKQNIPLKICKNSFLGSLSDIKSNALYLEHVYPHACDPVAATTPPVRNLV
jgi:hypothetical protein